MKECPKCTKQNIDEAEFCGFCGFTLSTKDYKKMKRFLAILIAATLSISLVGCNTTLPNSSYVETRLVSLFGITSPTGDVYFPFQDGNVEKISGDVYSARKTENRSHAVILE